MKIVLLHDTDEMDFGTDLLRFLQSLDLDAGSVMLAANHGRTLAAKEQAVLDAADVFVFFLTPGSSRHGQEGFASPSVCEEMGRAKERFKSQPDRIIYLADSNWRPQAIDQIAYTAIDRSSDRSIVQGLTRLAAELRSLGLLTGSATAPKTNTIPEIAEGTTQDIKSVCAYIATLPNGIVSFAQLDACVLKIAGNPTDAGILKNKLTRGWITYLQNTSAYSMTHWGWDVVEYERKKPIPSLLPASSLSLSALLQVLEGSGKPKDG